MQERRLPDTPEAKTTRSSAIYVELRRAILDGSLTPGTRLNARDLGQRFETG